MNIVGKFPSNEEMTGGRLLSEKDEFTFGQEERDMNELVKTDNSIMQVIERAAANPEVDIAKMERLLAMKERLDSQAAEAEFNRAMSIAQSEMSQVSADALNPQTQSKYASYSALDKALRPIYTKHGFSLSFDSGESLSEGWVKVICIVSHISGFSRSPHVDLPADGLGPKGSAVMTRTHATGGAMTYGMRYLLKMIFNVAVGENDNDGNKPVEPITKDQLSVLLAKIKEVGANKDQFAKVCKVETLDQLPADKFKRAMKILDERK